MSVRLSQEEKEQRERESERERERAVVVVRYQFIGLVGGLGRLAWTRIGVASRRNGEV